MKIKFRLWDYPLGALEELITVHSWNWCWQRRPYSLAEGGTPFLSDIMVAKQGDSMQSIRC